MYRVDGSSNGALPAVREGRHTRQQQRI